MKSAVWSRYSDRFIDRACPATWYCRWCCSPWLLSDHTIPGPSGSRFLPCYMLVSTNKSMIVVKFLWHGVPAHCFSISPQIGLSKINCNLLLLNLINLIYKINFKRSTAHIIQTKNICFSLQPWEIFCGVSNSIWGTLHPGEASNLPLLSRPQLQPKVW